MPCAMVITTLNDLELRASQGRWKGCLSNPDESAGVIQEKDGGSDSGEGWR